MSLNTTPKTWTSGETVAAADLNTEVRDAFNGVMAGWSTYTPVWSCPTTNPSIGNGTKAGRYIRIGKMVIFNVICTFNTTTTFGSGAFEFSLPVTPKQNDVACGSCFGVHSGSHNAGGAFIESGTNIHGVMNGAQLTATNPWTWGSGDTLSLWGMYEAA